MMGQNIKITFEILCAFKLRCFNFGELWQYWIVHRLGLQVFIRSNILSFIFYCVVVIGH